MPIHPRHKKPKLVLKGNGENTNLYTPVAQYSYSQVKYHNIRSVPKKQASSLTSSHQHSHFALGNRL